MLYSLLSNKLLFNDVLLLYSTPPTKQEAFEIFKADKGAEIFKILNDNKG